MAPVRLAETGRLETFSDSVLSITITLLVAEFVRPAHNPGQPLERLAHGGLALSRFWLVLLYRRYLNNRAGFARMRYSFARLASPAPTLSRARRVGY